PTLNHNHEMHPILSQSIPSKTTHHLLHILDTHPLPLTPILTIPHIFHHPQFKPPQNIVDVHHPPLRKVNVPGIIPKFQKT
ncbi:CoA transferase, partial [Bacillus altitudinis]|uniref:CoA transferase n=1 Tax=Bacillus altitudinis TaxID=293387 RepID=UPI0016439280